jgi:Fe-S cluster assembly ATP-binding protein
MGTALLDVRGLFLEAGGRTILENINFTIGTGETLALLGPNGSGKTSLIMAIMGFSNYRIISGEIFFKGILINNLDIDERARMGIGVMMQKPPSIKGVRTRQIAALTGGGKFDIEGAARDLDIAELLDRDVNYNFSGGEVKRSEVFQVMAQSPELALFDEPESGVDLENILLVGKGINKILGRGNGQGPKKSGLIITHTGFILDYAAVDKGCVLINKRLHCMGDPQRILSDIRKFGYEKCIECQKITP